LKSEEQSEEQSEITLEQAAQQAAPTRSARVQNQNQPPSSTQLAAQRATQWHQEANPLLSIEDVRGWLQRSGLVLYAPKPQLGAPAPSLVEATLGQAANAPELAELDAAKSLLARLISEGAAVPLNLLGVTGGMGTDQPDFVVSAAVFSYIFTLRGNKAWKQMPVTSGAVKVSPLALAAYEMLAAKVTLSAYDLATQLGNGVSEGAVLRALTELWSQLRVLPVPQQDGSATLWELASARFTKQIKAGANAGQPSALSALISLYLGQAIVATEDEVESFLSPLAPRSRLRDVLHALLSARQLETLVIDGKTLLHVAGELPAFAAVAPAAADESAEVEVSDRGSRISKFAAKAGSKIGTGLRAKPSFAKKPFGAKPFGAKPFGEKPGFGARPAYGRAEGGDRERRPFKRDGFAKPAFDKPWNDDRKARPAKAEGVDAAASEPAARSFERKPFERKPFVKREGTDSRPPRREFTPRDGDAPRRTFSKPGTFGRKREGVGAKPPFGGRSAAGRPPRRDFAAGGERSERPAGGGFKRPGSYSPRPSGARPSSGSGERPARPAFGAKPGFSRDRAAQGGEGAEAPKRVYRKFDAPRSPKPFGSKPAFGSKPSFGAKPSFGGRPSSSAPPRPFDGERPVRKFDGPRPERSERPSRPRTDRPGGEGRPSFDRKPGGSGGKKPFSKSAGFASKGGPFAKFADGKKPFRKPGVPKKTGSGFGPTKRKRDEGGE
jgi:23S rRNA pseudouridine2605 synthase